MKDYKDVIVGDTVTWALKSGTFEVTKVLYTFAGRPLPTRPAIEGKLRNPKKLSDYKIQPIGTQWDWSAINFDNEPVNEKLGFDERVT